MSNKLLCQVPAGTQSVDKGGQPEVHITQAAPGPIVASQSASLVQMTVQSAKVNPAQKLAPPVVCWQSP